MEDFGRLFRGWRRRVEIFEFRNGEAACADALDEEEGGGEDERDEEQIQGASKLALGEHTSIDMWIGCETETCQKAPWSPLPWSKGGRLKQ